MSRRSSTGERSRTDLSPTRMSPSEISIIRLTIRMAVVLPQPEGPTRTQISPAGTSSESLSTAMPSAPGYRLVTSRNSSEAASALAEGPSCWAVVAFMSKGFLTKVGAPYTDSQTCRAPRPLVGGRLERVLQRGQRRGIQPEGGRGQPVGEPRVLGQD